MSAYAFLDTWVLSDYTKPATYDLLSAWIRREGLTVVVTSLSLTEFYNPQGSHGDRATRVARFLGSHQTCIVDPVRVWHDEVMSYPAPLRALPVALDLERVSAEHRATALELFLRRDTLYLAQGKDVAAWSENYAKEKAGWLAEVERLIDRGVASGLLVRNGEGKLDARASNKEEFLCSLDRRLAVGQAWQLPVQTLVDLMVNAGTARLPAIRMSSLAFWHAYVEADAAFPMRRSGSDLGDILHLSLLPYCVVFTMDKNMHRMVQRIARDSRGSCAVLSRAELEAVLGLG